MYAMLLSTHKCDATYNHSMEKCSFLKSTIHSQIIFSVADEKATITNRHNFLPHTTITTTNSYRIKASVTPMRNIKIFYLYILTISLVSVF